MYSKVINKIFDSILKEITENENQISDDLMEILISLFKTDFLESLQFIDEYCVSVQRTSNCLRQVFEVKDDNKSKSKPDRYYCVIDSNYCSCDHFRTGVLNDSIVFCKHLIAAKLSNAMNKCLIVEQSDQYIDGLWTKHIIN